MGDGPCLVPLLLCSLLLAAFSPCAHCATPSAHDQPHAVTVGVDVGGGVAGDRLHANATAATPRVLFPVHGTTVFEEPATWPSTGAVSNLMTVVDWHTSPQFPVLCIVVDAVLLACVSSSWRLMINDLPLGQHTFSFIFAAAPHPPPPYASHTPCTWNPHGVWCTGVRRALDGAVPPRDAVELLSQWFGNRYPQPFTRDCATARGHDATAVAYGYLHLSRALLADNQPVQARAAAQDAMLWATIPYTQSGDDVFRSAAAALGAGDGTFERDVVLHLQHTQLAVRARVPEPPRPVTPPPSPPPAIGVVSLCEYDDAVTPLSRLSDANKRQYTDRHGYGYHMLTQRLDAQRPPAWSKVVAVHRLLFAYDWVFWLDCDSFVMNQTLTLHQLLPPTTDDNIHMVVSEDAATINTGVFAVRNSDAGRSLLQAWHGEANGLFVKHAWWEQAALQAMVSTVGMRVTEEEHPWAAALTYVPQRWMNSYPRAIARQLIDPVTREPLHAVYKPGDFIISFSGCRVFAAPTECNDMYRAAAAASAGV